jgi:small subunit ribosomal protein S3
MSVVKRIIRDAIERVKVDELLADEYVQAGYGGITLTKTPLGAQINLFAMRPGRVIGKRGRAIKEASERLERELGLANPQITVVEVEFPELNPQIQAARIANALERGIHYRRALFWSLNRTMEAGAIGCEILIKGPLRSNRGRYEKVVEGYVPKSGDPALTYVKKATIHVKMKKGAFGVNVSIVPPDAKFPDKVNLDGLPIIEYPEEEYELPAGVEPDLPETPVEPEVTETVPEEKPADVTDAVDAAITDAPQPVADEAQPVEAEAVEIVPEEKPADVTDAVDAAITDAPQPVADEAQPVEAEAVEIAPEEKPPEDTDVVETVVEEEVVETATPDVPEPTADEPQPVEDKPESVEAEIKPEEEKPQATEPEKTDEVPKAEDLETEGKAETEDSPSDEEE